MAVMWVCEYIHRRAEKDKILHSKDLHTSIVAAFSCLLSWVTLHPYLLGDKVQGTDFHLLHFFHMAQTVVFLL